MQSTVEFNRQEYDEKMKKLKENLKSIIPSTITSIVDDINISKYSPDQKGSSKAK